MKQRNSFLVIDADTRKPLRFSRFTNPYLALQWAYNNAPGDFVILDSKNNPISAREIVHGHTRH